MRYRSLLFLFFPPQSNLLWFNLREKNGEISLLITVREEQKESNKITATISRRFVDVSS